MLSGLLSTISQDADKAILMHLGAFLFLVMRSTGYCIQFVLGEATWTHSEGMEPCLFCLPQEQTTHLVPKTSLIVLLVRWTAEA